MRTESVPGRTEFDARLSVAAGSATPGRATTFRDGGSTSLTAAYVQPMVEEHAAAC